MSKPVPLLAVALLAAAGVALLGATVCIETTMLVQQSDANKAQPRAVVCFRADGQPARPFATDWRECRTVALREIRPAS